MADWSHHVASGQRQLAEGLGEPPKWTGRRQRHGQAQHVEYLFRGLWREKGEEGQREKEERGERDRKRGNWGDTCSKRRQ